MEIDLKRHGLDLDIRVKVTRAEAALLAAVVLTLAGSGHLPVSLGGAVNIIGQCAAPILTGHGATSCLGSPTADRPRGTPPPAVPRKVGP